MMNIAYVSVQLLKWRGSRDDDIVLTWVVEDINNEQQRCVPEHEYTNYDVRYQHACQDEVSLGPESGREPDCDQRKSVTTQVEDGHNEKNDHPHNYWIS